MTTSEPPVLQDILFGLIPANGSAVGNQGLREQFLLAAKEAGHPVAASDFDLLREALIRTPTTTNVPSSPARSFFRWPARARGGRS